MIVSRSGTASHTISSSGVPLLARRSSEFSCGAQADAQRCVNDTCRLEEVRLGSSGLSSGTSGTEYFDAFASTCTTYIGP